MVAVGLVAAVPVIVAGRWAQVRFGNSTSPITIDAALDRFRSTTTSAATEHPGATPAPGVTAAPAPTTEVPGGRTALPLPGVYRYATLGREGIDALTRPTHEYPAETAVVVEPAGCGVRVSWTPLLERTEWWEMCLVDGGLALVRYGGTHEFFGQRDERTLECPSEAWLVPPAAAGIDTWTVTCSGSGMVDVRTTTTSPVVVEIDGEEVEAVRVDTTVDTTGDTTSVSSRTLLLAADGVVVGWHDEVLGHSDSEVGIVEYTEEVDLVVRSLDPVG